MEYKKMREYTHEEFVNLVLSLSEEELLDLSKNYGGYPVLFRMALDERINHILSQIDVLIDGPFIQAERDITLELRGSRNQRILYRGVDF